MVIGPAGPCRNSHCMTNGCSCCNSKTTGLIHAILSSVKSSLPIDVQRHGHCPVWPLQKFPLSIKVLVEVVTPKPANRFTPSQVLWWFVFNFCQLHGDIDGSMFSHLCLKWCFGLRKLVNWQLSSDRSAYQLIKWDANLMCHQMCGRHVLLGLSLLTSDFLLTISRVLCVESWTFEAVLWNKCQHDPMFLAATKQLYKWYFPSVRLSVCLSVRLSVCPSVRHTFLTMFPSSYHHEIFRSYYQWQKWRPCKRSRSEVKGQGHRGHNPTLPFPDCNSSLNSHMMMKWCI